MNEREAGLPLEQFIQALTSQLDRAQSTMALKARTGLPLTFAVKDISIDLRTHIDMSGSVVRIRPAGPGDTEASVIHLALTTITKPMIEENTVQFEAEKDEPPMNEVLGNSITDDDQKRLEWAGVHSLTQLRDLEKQTGSQAIQNVLGIPVQRLQQALQKASQPFVSHIQPESLPDSGPQETPLLRIRGINLLKDGPPQVRVNGEALPMLQATHKSLLVAPLPHQLGGTLAVETAPGNVFEKAFSLYPDPPVKNGSAVANGSGRTGTPPVPVLEGGEAP